ncbi:MAG: type 1 glutamine amidotransferase [Arenibacterium sp.]
MKIGILQTGHAPEALLETFGDYDLMFQKLLGGNGFTFVSFDVENNEFPESIDAADGWLITGSRHGAYEDHPWIKPLEALIRDIYAASRPLVGVCFGHQIIATALGGKVAKYDGGWAVGRVEYERDGQKIGLNAWHQDQIVELPEGAQVLGGNEFCRYGILAYGDTIYSVQPHPEYGADFIEGLIRTRGKGLVPDHLLQEAKENLRAGPVAQGEIGAEMAAFFRKARV